MNEFAVTITTIALVTLCACSDREAAVAAAERSAVASERAAVASERAAVASERALEAVERAEAAVAEAQAETETEAETEAATETRADVIFRPNLRMRAAEPVGHPLMHCTSQADYNRCVLRHLRTPQTAREYEALINANKETGNPDRACVLMREVITRYPGSSTARRFEAYAQRQCRN